jgi:hypothetical protein
MANTLAKSDNEDLASWDFARNHAAYDRSPNERVHNVEYFMSYQHFG